MFSVCVHMCGHTARSFAAAAAQKNFTPNPARARAMCDAHHLTMRTFPITPCAPAACDVAVVAVVAVSPVDRSIV